MNYYSLALFLHVGGAMGIFVSIGVWLVGLAALRRAQCVEQVRALAWLMLVVSPLMVVSVLLVLAAGFAMALSSWGLRTGWIAVALASLLAIGPIGPLILDAQMRMIWAQAGAEAPGPFSDQLAAQIRHPLLGIAAQTLATGLLGIVYLMTVKPGLVGAIVAMLVALGLGIAGGMLLWRGSSGGKGHANSNSATANDPYLRRTFWTRRW
jgi:hypothetical protein